MADPRPPDAHAWFRARLDAQALGLLDDDEERRFLAHAESCPGCTAAMKAHREHAALDAPDTHIPPHLIARWDRAARRIRGLPRRLIREHLEHCAACRQDLEALGFRPELPFEPGLEEAADDRAQPAARSGEAIRSAERAAEPGEAVLVGAPRGARAEEPPRVVVIQRSRQGWAGYALGGLAGVGFATAAAILIFPLLIREQATPPGATPTPSSPATGEVGRPAPTPAAPPATDVGRPPTPADTEPGGSRPVLGALPPAVSLESALRTGETPVTRIPLRPGQRILHVVLPDLFLADSARLGVTLLDARGAPILHATRRYGELAAGRTLMLGDAARALSPGRCRLLFESQDDPTLPAIEFHLELTRAPVR